MVIDTSAIVAILLAEPNARLLVAAIELTQTRLVSVATVLESSLVLLGRFGEAGEAQLDVFLRDIRATIVPVNEHHLLLARDAARTYGRGRHRAGLNYGDCFSYALSVSSGEPLLFVGDDFTHTDVVPALS